MKFSGLQWSAAGAKRRTQSRRSMGWTSQSSWAVKLEFRNASEPAEAVYLSSIVLKRFFSY